MNISYPESHEKISKEIVTSWTNVSHYTLVASPLNYPSSIFKLLRSKYFHESCHLDTDKLSIAYLPIHTYKTSEEFIYRVLKNWNIDIDDVDGNNAQIEHLEEALDILESTGKTPIILLPKFHKTIEKLSWELGAKLRYLEAEFGLCTVVELPVLMSRLRERWEMIDEKENFICSDFGQGHSSIVLLGFECKEVGKLVKDASLNDQYISIIQKWSGGLPELVRWLIQEAQTSKSVEYFESIARKGCIEQCKIFLKWLDAPNSDYYKERISALWRNAASEEQRAEVRDHEWQKIIINRDGFILSSAIGFACTKSVGGNFEQTLSSIVVAIKNRSDNEVDGLISGLSDFCRSENKFKYISAIIPVWKLATELSPDFINIEMTSKKGGNQLKKDKSDMALKICDVLNKWHEFSKGVNLFNRLLQRKSDLDWRLSDCLCGRGEGNEKGSDIVSIQLIMYRLYEAEKIHDSNAALKCILEIPEQILQVYCARKLNISVWKAPEFLAEDIELVSELWKNGSYIKPRKNSRLEFIHMLYIGWVMMKKLEKDDRLFNNFSDMVYLHESYEEIRNQPSHSITFVNEKKWSDFYQQCIVLANNLSQSLMKMDGKETLPRLDEMIEFIAK